MFPNKGLLKTMVRQCSATKVLGRPSNSLLGTPLMLFTATPSSIASLHNKTSIAATKVFPPCSPTLSALRNMSTTTPEAQPAPSTLVDSAPVWLRPYLRLARLDKPIGTWLLLLPCYIGAALGAGAGAVPSPELIAAFAIGSVAMRGAGCTVNDMWDVKFDQKVERTKSRPLASGALTRPKAAAFLLVQCLAGLATLPIMGGANTAAIAFASLPWVCVYPLMKRFTNYPQAVLGVTFNWGIYVGYAAVQSAVDLGVLLPLHLAGVAWTIFYDTIYAHQDKNDDIKVGVKSTALHFGENTSRVLAGYGAVAAAGLAAAGFYAHETLPFYMLGVAAPAMHMAWQLKTVDYSSRASCMATFVSNKWVGAMIFLGVCAGNLAMVLKSDEEKRRDADGPHTPAATQLSPRSADELVTRAMDDLLDAVQNGGDIPRPRRTVLVDHMDSPPLLPVTDSGVWGWVCDTFGLREFGRYRVVREERVWWPNYRIEWGTKNTDKVVQLVK